MTKLPKPPWKIARRRGIFKQPSIMARKLNSGSGVETDASEFTVASFPLTPALSLGERERINPVLSQTQTFWDFSKTVFADANLKLNQNTIYCFSPHQPGGLPYCAESNPLVTTLSARGQRGEGRGEVQGESLFDVESSSQRFRVRGNETYSCLKLWIHTQNISQ